ncbi:DUF948 domain-containing protein [Peribacillus cavernae]|uniref:DUF948 domain-containing protein n=1 Tax=Peribacillus cavernae TaxID=1674310 RepID=A0A433HI02_9BACI|nr:DUF948 domain-containing protein [Peribacillus cavernae]MDQ0220515.1 uncharacterized protein YoxC [Peribacillus cavernae]RUQ27994.1 DUF948 domain-containing protein [Peribacillus cavernae]
MIIKVSVASASVAFVCLAAKLIQTLGETQRTIAEVKNSVTGLTEESQRLIHSANQVTVDIQSKIKSFEPLLESAQDVGEVIHSVTDTVKRAGTVQNNETPRSETIDTNNHPATTASSAPGNDHPASADSYTPSNDTPVNTISHTPSHDSPPDPTVYKPNNDHPTSTTSSKPDGGVKIRIN